MRSGVHLPGLHYAGHKVVQQRLEHETVALVDQRDLRVNTM